MSRTYVVTGSASGVGQATARLLRDRGHRVIGVDLHGAEVTADLSVPQGRLRAAAEAVELAGGSVDAVIACAGISAPVAKTMAINYFGVVELLTALRPALTASAAPRVAVVSSMASLQQNSSALVEAALSGDEEATLAIGDALAQEGPQQGYLNYPSSKTRTLAVGAQGRDLRGVGRRGIPVNAVAPGTVLTPMTKDLLSTPEVVAMVDGAVPMPLNGHQSPESVAELLIWLASAENTHTTGQTIYIDGGAEATLRGDDVWRWNDSADA